MRSRLVLLSLGFTACARASNGLPLPVDASATPDGELDAPVRIDAATDAPTADAPTADAPTPDAPMADAMPDAMPGVGTHLLLSEIELAPSGGEFIEIVNPTAQAIALDNYYLSDNGTYFRLPAGTQSLDSGDFIARFKAGTNIASHGVVTVSLDTAANFTAATGVAPTYSLADATITTVASSGTPSLTNGGEVVVLFTWDGTSDLVTDVDIMLAGAPTSANGLVSKSGVTVKGSTYKTDAGTITNQAATPGSGKSTKRLTLETGHETENGTGNGMNGDDETSEQTGTTWDKGSFTAPTPGLVPASLLP
jgi:hypothetical protein